MGIEKTIKRIIQTVKSKLKALVLIGFRIVPIKDNKIIFDNFLGKGYGDNPKYIAEELLRRNLDLDLVWVVKDEGEKFPNGIRTVKYGSIRALYEFATAKVWIDNVRNTYRPRKRNKQFYIQTWHSSIGLKKSEQEVEENLSKDYVRDAKYDGTITDLMISNGKYRTKRFQTGFWYKGEILECGFPRNDILVNPTSGIRKKVYEQLGIPYDKKIALYAPTFRQSNMDKNTTLEIFRFDYEKIRKVLEGKFGGSFVLMLRMHPNIAKDCSMFEYNDNVINATNYPDMQELLAFSDVLITDYSSCMFDAMYVHHAVFLFAKDVDEYTTKERGLLFDIRKLPCTLSENEDQLIDNISDYSNAKFVKRCDEFFDEIGFYEPGNASKTVADLIVSKIRSYQL
jgi:CDP-glycerol glycerophosphotransferase